MKKILSKQVIQLGMAFLLPFIVLMLALILSTPQLAHAAGIVGDGSPASCDEAALRAALSGGGLVGFNCGPAPHTINMANTIDITQSTTINGGGLITIGGNGTFRIFNVNHSNEPRLTLEGLTVRGGYTSLNGGAIDVKNNSVVTITNSILSENSADGAGGGAINVDGGAIVIIVNSAIISNTAGNNFGGGIRVAGGAEGVTVVNSTLSNNTATRRGGAILADGGITLITNTTIFSNAAFDVGVGGGIHRQNGTVRLKNTIVAGSNAGDNCVGNNIFSEGNNLADDSSCTSFTEVADVRLGPLADNGGNTLTHALLSDSPAIDQGDDSACPATDQRGVGRPQDGNGDDVAVCDIGAYEFIWPQISMKDTSVLEGDSGTTPAVFDVTLSTTSAETVTVEYITANGTAVEPEDYITATGTITFSPGSTKETITVQVKGDTLYEADEDFFVNLSNPTKATIDDGQGRGVILNDDDPPTLSINDTSVTEGDSGTTPAVFTVTLSPLSGLTATVAYATADGTATAGVDYIAKTGVLTFTPGTTEKNITVMVIGDTEPEGNENFFVNLSNPKDATIIKGQGEGTIIGDDGGTVQQSIYLPLVLSGQNSPGPDLIVEKIIVADNNIQVVIKNQGDQPVPIADEFWVDFYVDPNPPPTDANDVWNDGRSTYGAVWGVTAPALPMEPGRVVTLTVGQDYYWPSLSNLPDLLAADTPVYGQVDAANTNTDYGAVLENHEIDGRPYNNIFVDIVSAPVVLGQVVEPSPGGQSQPVSAGHLPPRTLK